MDLRYGGQIWATEGWFDAWRGDYENVSIFFSIVFVLWVWCPNLLCLIRKCLNLVLICVKNMGYFVIFFLLLFRSLVLLSSLHNLRSVFFNVRDSWFVICFFIAICDLVFSMFVIRDSWFVIRFFIAICDLVFDIQYSWFISPWIFANWKTETFDIQDS